jgi:hypothetical protein
MTAASAAAFQKFDHVKLRSRSLKWVIGILNLSAQTEMKGEEEMRESE